MRTDLDRVICGFLNWWDDHLEEARFPEGEQEEAAPGIDFGACIYPITWDQDQRALVAQLCESGCCTSVYEIDGLVAALRELVGRSAPDALPPDNDRLFRFSEDDQKVWLAEFAKSHPDAFHEDARGPGDWERVKAEHQEPPEEARRVGQLPASDSPFWDELVKRLTNREAIVLWNMLNPMNLDAEGMRQSELTAKLVSYMSARTCERAMRTLRRRGLAWEWQEKGQMWITLSNSGIIVARRLMK